MKELKTIQLLRVFRIKYDKLKKLKETDNLDDILEISAILRHFLIDGNMLSQDVANEYGLQCSYPIDDNYSKEGHEIFVTKPNSSRPTFNFVNRANFIKLNCFQIDGKVFTIDELIDLLANCAGGVHHDGRKSPMREYSIKLLETDIANSCLDCLKTISEIVLQGLLEIRKAVEKEFSFAEQRKRKRQPEVIFNDSGGAIVLFSGSTYLEAYSYLDFSNSPSILFSFLPDEEQVQYPAIVFEIGNRKENRKLSIRLISKEKIACAVYDGQKCIAKCVVPHIHRSSNIIYVYYHKTKKRLYFANQADKEYVADSAMEVPEPIEGKVVIGQDLKGQNGATFRHLTGPIHWPKGYNIKEFREMLNHPSMMAERNEKWTIPISTKNRVFITTMYNQANNANNEQKD